MAFAITDILGFETGGGELVSVSGTVTFIASAARSGGYGMRTKPGSTATYTLNNPISDGASGIVYSFQIQATDFSPNTGPDVYFRIVDDVGGDIATLSQMTDGKIRLTDQSSTTTDSSTSPFSDTTYHRVDLFVDFTSSGNFILHVDQSEIINVSSGDFSSGNGINQIIFRGIGPSNAFDTDFDDIYIGTGATGVDDFLGDFQIKGHQGSDASTATPDFENDGTVDTLVDLSDGTWNLTFYTPTAGSATPAQYNDDNQWGAVAFDDAANLNGQNGGPSGDSDYTGATIHAANYIFRGRRGTGPGADHFILHGKWSGSGNADITTGSDLSPTTGNLDYTEFVTAGNIPAVTDYAVMGFEHSGGAGQDFLCEEMWVEIGFVPAPAAVPFPPPFRPRSFFPHLAR